VIGQAPRLQLRCATIARVNGEGTVDLTTPTGTVTSIRHARAYSPRSGDTIAYLADPNGNWLVLG
jgi:hypothetical protein